MSMTDIKRNQSNYDFDNSSVYSSGNIIAMSDGNSSFASGAQSETSIKQIG